MKKFLRISAFGLYFFGSLSGTGAFCGQQPSSTPQPQTSSPAATAAAKSKSKKYSHASDFLMRGTVFSEKALALPGAELRIRRSGEKKFRWETRTNSRGEFAVRVPQGADYELVVRAKGFGEQAKKVDAKSGAREEDMVFRMELAGGGKTKGKK
jgi:hypothetical protein